MHGQVTLDASIGTANVTNATIIGNTMTCRNAVSYCRAFGFDGASAGRTTGIIIASNYIYNTSIRSQVNGDGNAVVGNVMIGMRPDIVYGNRNETIETQAYSGISQNNIIANNYLSNSYAPCISFRNDAAGTNSGHVVANNILHNCGGATYSGQSNATSVALNKPSGANIGASTVRNNIIFSDGTSDTVSYAGVKQTVTAFNAGCTGGDICANNLGADPLITKATQPSLRATSPAIRGGFRNVMCADLRGRPCWAPPDIGAYQATSGDPAATRSPRN